jgi:arylsulfatase A-like enzyme
MSKTEGFAIKDDSASCAPKARLEPPRWTPLAVVAVAWLADELALRRAWAPGSDRWLLGLALAGTLGAGLLAAFAYGALVARTTRRAWPRALAIGAPLGASLGWMASDTHLARVACGGLAPWLLPPGGALALALAHRLLATLRPPAARAPRRALAVLASAATFALVIENARLPQALYPSLHALCACIALAGAVALCALLSSVEKGARSPVAALLGGAALSALVAALALGRSANVRFVAYAQAPLAGQLLRALTVATSPPDVNANSYRNAAPKGRADGRVAGGLERVPEQAPQSGAQLGSSEGSKSMIHGDANLVLITIDALRADEPLSSLERRPGVLRFARAYAQAPHTAWSIASMLTGVPPERLAGRALPTLADRLRARHFYTDALYPAGLFFDGRHDLEHYARTRFGFEWTDTRTLDARTLTDAAIGRLAEERHLWADEPRTFLWVHYFDPHEPYVAHGVAADAPAQVRYRSEVAAVDREIARLFDALAAGPRPTLVVVTADHGEEFGEHGGAYHGTTVYEEQVRVPLALFWVGASPFTERELDAPVELVDLAPTVLELLELDGRAHDPRSLVAGLAPVGPAHARDAHAIAGSRRMLLRDRYKLIKDTRGGLLELYDLAEDPHEQHDLADREPARTAELDTALAQWFGLEPRDALARTLADPGAPAVRRAAAARALGDAHAPDGDRPLHAALDDPDVPVRAEAALALAELSDPAAAPLLLSLLDAPSYRHRAALGLGHLRDPRALAALRECLDDADPELRRHAVHYLGFLGDERDGQRIAERARTDVRLRAEAWLSLGHIVARTGSPSAAALLVEQLSAEDREDARAQLASALRLALEAGPRLPPALASRARALLTGAPN